MHEYKQFQFGPAITNASWTEVCTHQPQWQGQKTLIYLLCHLSGTVSALKEIYFILSLKFMQHVKKEVCKFDKKTSKDGHMVL